MLYEARPSLREVGVDIILGAKDPDLIDAWEMEFSGLDKVTVRGGNLLLVRADALVSPANSFGFMDGGFDWSISELFSWKIQGIVQKAIREKHGGELLVGAAEVVATAHEQFPYLICAPTMRVPHPIPETVNAFLAMRAILRAVEEFNKPDLKIRSIAIPGLGTGIGRIPPYRCARQMRAGYDEVYGKKSNHFASLNEAIKRHQHFLNGDD